MRGTPDALRRGMQDERVSARTRALRAARAMSIAAALALGPGCSMSHDSLDSGVDAAPPVTDGGIVDSGPVDSGPVDSGVDSGLADSGIDAGTCEDIEWTGSCCEPMPRECCETTFVGEWIEESGCCATCIEGPLTPPSAPV